MRTWSGTNSPWSAPGTTLTVTTTTASSDDAEETVSSTVMDINDATLDIPREGAAPQLVGVRFNGLGIPQYALITSAQLQFQASGASLAAVNVRIRQEAADNAATFTTTNGNISGRTLTTGFVDWAIAAWSNNEFGADTTSPDLSSLVQTVVNRPGWASGNSMAFVLSENGTTSLRQASAFDDAGTGFASTACGGTVGVSGRVIPGEWLAVLQGKTRAGPWRLTVSDVKAGDTEPIAGGLVKRTVTLQQGIPIDAARAIVKYLKDQKLKKVQAAIQADQVRVSSPSKDELQGAIRLLKAHDFGVELQFGNYRE